MPAFPRKIRHRREMLAKQNEPAPAPVAKKKAKKKAKR